MSEKRGSDEAFWNGYVEQVRAGRVDGLRNRYGDLLNARKRIARAVLSGRLAGVRDELVGELLRRRLPDPLTKVGVLLPLTAELRREGWGQHRVNRGLESTETVALKPPFPGHDIVEAAAGSASAGTADLIAYLQRLVGYTLTGLTGEQMMAIPYGSGANGKSTLLETIAGLLGDYAQQTPSETLVATKNRGIPNDLARLRGARFVSAVETGEGNRLAESLVKQMTGGDRIAARFLYQEVFEFTPAFKLFLATNHKPVIRGTDAAIWRRIHLIPFDVTIPEAERDPNLKAKLAAEASGILNWALEGCRTWQREGLQPPTEVRAATAEYRGEMDVLAAFLEDQCVEQAGAKVQSSKLYAAYKTWCDENGEYAVSNKAFSLRLRERGVENMRKSSGMHWLGLGLLADPSRLLQPKGK